MQKCLYNHVNELVFSTLRFDMMCLKTGIFVFTEINSIVPLKRILCLFLSSLLPFSMNTLVNALIKQPLYCNSHFRIHNSVKIIFVDLRSFK